jgi:hypothetical protein
MTDEEKEEYSELVESGATFEQKKWNPVTKKLEGTGTQTTYDPYGKVDGVYVNPELQDIVANTTGDLSHLPPGERNRYRTDYDLMEEKIDDKYMGGSGAKQLQFTEGYNFPETGIASIDFLGNLLEGGAKRTRKFFADPDYKNIFGNQKKSVLEAGKYKYKGMDLTPEAWNRLSLSEQEKVYDQYQKDRGAGHIDAYGNVHPNYYRGPNDTFIETGGGDQDRPLWARLGYGSEQDYINAGGGGGGGGTTGTTGTGSIATGPVTGLNLTNQYHIPGASNFYSNLPASMFDPATDMLTLADGGRAGYAGGGIADLRQGYFLGKLVKSITKPFKGAIKSIGKFAKSDTGKMAIMAALMGAPFGGGPGATWFGKGSGWGALKSGIGNLFTGSKALPFDWAQKAARTGEGTGLWSKMLGSMSTKPLPWILGASALGGLTAMGDDDDENDMWKKWLADKKAADDYWIPRFDASNFRRITSADGGRIGYNEGGLGVLGGAMKPKEKGFNFEDIMITTGKPQGTPIIMKIGEKFNVMFPGQDEVFSFDSEQEAFDYMKTLRPFNKDGGRIGYQDGGYNDEDEDDRVAALRAMYGLRRGAQEGGLMDLGGMEKDYRQEGGFVPLGGEERADDVPARLSKNEFVFTADAVRAAGGGDIDKGAEVMENVMENLEKGGNVSEESQGLEGARNMFATSQRLEGVL